MANAKATPIIGMSGMAENHLPPIASNIHAL
jgi:hypothetical protein